MRKTTIFLSVNHTFRPMSVYPYRYDVSQLFGHVDVPRRSCPGAERIWAHVTMGRKRKNIEDCVHEFDDFRHVLGKVDSGHLVCNKWCRPSISGDPQHFRTNLKEHVKSTRHPRTMRTESGRYYWNEVSSVWHPRSEYKQSCPGSYWTWEISDCSLS